VVTFRRPSFPRIITYAWLEDRGACYEQREKFRRVFGRGGARISRKLLRAMCQRFSVTFLVHNMGADARLTYYALLRANKRYNDIQQTWEISSSQARECNLIYADAAWEAYKVERGGRT
jgi:hypothetical protein